MMDDRAWGLRRGNFVRYVSPRTGCPAYGTVHSSDQEAREVTVVPDTKLISHVDHEVVPYAMIERVMQE